MLLKIGQLARQTGLTVRTLHHYDAIGLLRPSGRADNGYRMYNRADIARLHQVQALRRLGLGLEETGALLAGAGADGKTGIAALVTRQVAQLNEQIEHATLLRDRLLRMQEDFAAQAEPDLEEWLMTLELMAIFDKHLTPEETARWRAHSRAGRATQAEAWKALMADFQALLRDGVPPDAAAAQAGVRRWMDLTEPHLQRDPQLMLKLDALYREDPAMQAAMGMQQVLLDYLGLAAAHYRLARYAPYLEPAQLALVRQRYLVRQGHALIVVGRDLRTLLDAGTPAGAPAVLAVCARWRALFAAYFGTDPDIRARILHAQETDPELTRGSGWDAPLRAYLRAGLAHLDAEENTHA